MTPQERKALAESLVANPLFGATLDKMQADATAALIHAAKTEQARLEAQIKVRAIIEFRDEIKALLIEQRAPRTPA